MNRDRWDNPVLAVGLAAAIAIAAILAVLLGNVLSGRG